VSGSSIVDDTYVDAFDERRRIEPEVLDQVHRAMGLEPGEDAPDEDWTAVVPPGSTLPAPGTVELEDGTDCGRLDRLPPDVPFGYHRLLRDDGDTQLLITGPGRCFLPPALRDWGWVVQLHALRSEGSWGIGDLVDLRSLARWSAGVGAGFVAVSPLGAPNPGPQPEPSPYYPSTRRFVSPLFIRPDAIASTSDVSDLAHEGRRLNEGPDIDRPAVIALKLEALERIWAHDRGDRAAFTEWRSRQGASLERWAAFSVLSERHGAGWRAWPAEARQADGPIVERVAAEAPDAVDFHAWVQWCLDDQLAAASAPLRRIADMPVGVDPGGFDAWDWQAQLAPDASVGAPPDRFNTAGQNWGLPPFVPHRLRQAHYAPFIGTIRAQLRHAGGLRIDHVLGLFRLWWVPGGNDPARGAYVRYPTDELLEIVALESHRANAVIIGEDLGTVPAGVRRELRRRNVLSTRLAFFERTPPSRYPRQAFAGVTTHDLPTIAGTLSGSDLEDQRAAGLRPDPAALDLLRRRLRVAAGVDRDTDFDELSVALHRRLAASPAMLVAATLEDALGVEERPNLPGTTSSRPANWSRALPLSLEELSSVPAVGRLAEALRRTG
jgi:4-alpha-glucanotransferase